MPTVEQPTLMKKGLRRLPQAPNHNLVLPVEQPTLMKKGLRPVNEIVLVLSLPKPVEQPTLMKKGLRREDNPLNAHAMLPRLNNLP